MSYMALPVLVGFLFSPKLRLHENPLSRDWQQQNSHRIISLLKADTGSPRGRAEYPRISASSWLWLYYKRQIRPFGTGGYEIAALTFAKHPKSK